MITKKASLVAAILAYYWVVPLLAAPTIYVDWEETNPPEPALGTHYVIDTTNEGTSEFPKVILLAGSQTWRIWSNDSVTGARSDIGEISSPASANFAVTIERPDGSAGARTVKGISLVPNGDAYHSSVNHVGCIAV